MWLPSGSQKSCLVSNSTATLCTTHVMRALWHEQSVRNRGDVVVKIAAFEARSVGAGALEHEREALEVRRSV